MTDTWVGKEEFELRILYSLQIQRRKKISEESVGIILQHGAPVVHDKWGVDSCSCCWYSQLVGRFYKLAIPFLEPFLIW